MDQHQMIIRELDQLGIILIPSIKNVTSRNSD